MIEFSSLKEMPKALSKLQNEIKNPSRNRQGYNYTYADLESVLESIKKSCCENGFSVMQMPYSKDNEVGVETLLLHDSGEYIKGSFGSNMVKHDPQSVGSQITYYRRYSLLAIFNLSQEDDDGAILVDEKNKNNNTKVDYEKEIDNLKPTVKQLNAMFYKVKENSCGLDDFNKHLKPNINLKQYKWLMDNFSLENFNICISRIKGGK